MTEKLKERKKGISKSKKVLKKIRSLSGALHGTLQLKGITNNANFWEKSDNNEKLLKIGKRKLRLSS
jgi:hypothetical protein